MDGLAELTATLELLERRKRVYQLEYYEPYLYQVKFHNAEGHLTPGKPARQKALLAANKIGKTRCAAFEVAIHATGRYPNWWKGAKFWSPPEILCCGLTNDSVRDIWQRELFGDPTDGKSMGSGTVPIDCCGKSRNKMGVQNALDSVRVKHVSGLWSRVYFRAYEQGWKKFQGIAFDVAAPDEEPPPDIWSQLLRSTIARPRAVVMLTMTAEEGMTEVVHGFLNNLQKGQAVITATWDDARHLVKADGTLTDTAQQIYNAFRPHEREMRRYGTPLQGAGLIFPVNEADIVVDPMEIPIYWRRVNGIDFGWDHPFAAVGLAWDRDNDVVYVTNEYKESHQTPPVHVSAVKAWGAWIPNAWPHDGLNTEKGGGEALIKNYRDNGLYCLNDRATNPPDYAQGQQEGQGGNSVEAPLYDMLERMQTGRWKVFKTCKEWLTERRQYHHDEKGKIVKQFEDVISASRYAYMMLRQAITKPVKPRNQPQAIGMRNWSRAA